MCKIDVKCSWARIVTVRASTFGYIRKGWKSQSLGGSAHAGWAGLALAEQRRQRWVREKKYFRFSPTRPMVFVFPILRVSLLPLPHAVDSRAATKTPTVHSLSSPLTQHSFTPCRPTLARLTPLLFCFAQHNNSLLHIPISTTLDLASTTALHVNSAGEHAPSF